MEEQSRTTSAVISRAGTMNATGSGLNPPTLVRKATTSIGGTVARALGKSGVANAPPTRTPAGPAVGSVPSFGKPAPHADLCNFAGNRSRPHNVRGFHASLQPVRGIHSGHPGSLRARDFTQKTAARAHRARLRPHFSRGRSRDVLSRTPCRIVDRPHPPVWPLAPRPRLSFASGACSCRQTGHFTRNLLSDKLASPDPKDSLPPLSDTLGRFHLGFRYRPGRNYLSRCCSHLG